MVMEEHGTPHRDADVVRSRCEQRCQQHEEEAEELRQQGKSIEALRKLEEALVLARRLQRGGSADGGENAVWRVCKQIAAMCNTVGMSFLQRGKEEQCMELLRRAVDLTETPSITADEEPARVKLRAITYNNIGCYFRKMEQPREALVNLERALKLLNETTGSAEHIGDTHLNICAILSQMNRHHEALEHAQIALILLQEELYFDQNEGGVIGDELTSRFGVLAIAYHNIAVEQEYLGRIDDCIMSYCKAVELAQTKLSSSHPIATALSASFENAKETWASQPSTTSSWPESQTPARARPASATPSKRSSVSGSKLATSRSSATEKKSKFAKSTSRQAVTRLSQGRPSSRAPVRPKSAAPGGQGRSRISSSLGSNTTRTARQAAAAEAENLYNDSNFNYSGFDDGDQMLDMLTPRGGMPKGTPGRQSGRELQEGDLK